MRYAHFHQLVDSQKLQDAASDLVAMLQEDLAPRSWWPILLCDSVQLLQYSRCESCTMHNALLSFSLRYITLVYFVRGIYTTEKTGRSHGQDIAGLG